EKEYVVTVDKPINQDFVERMSGGVSILGVNTKKCKVTQEGPNRFRITLTQGMNRQIRRMCEALGYEVQTLQRTRIMHLSLHKIPLGQWRNMTDTEIAEMMRLIASSTKTEEGSTGKKRTTEAPAKGNKPNPRGSAPASKAAYGGGPAKGGKSTASGKREKPKSSGTARGSRGASKGSPKGAAGGKGRGGAAKGGRRR
ncbi:MAG: 23S rRNA pseudouridine(2604) synthase RluF, partial [Hymenobacteraceae bacterium]|nr:23S rRNA pseudouridine(2604) synthase RluF [Hymenobacteraceae bacterium]